MTLLSALAGDLEIEALLSDAAQLNAMLRVERALAEASAEADFVSDAAARAVRSAIDSYVPDWEGLAEGMRRDGVVVPALVRQLRPLLPPPHVDALHRGATSQDIVDTALMLQLAGIFDIYEERLSALLAALDAFAATAGDRSLMGHTRMQAALTTTWSTKIASWREPLMRHLRALGAMRGSLLVVQLGGPVGDRMSFEGRGEDVARNLAARLDLGYASPWQTQRDPIAGLGHLLAMMAGAIGKIGADVALMAQSEVRIVRIEGGGTSSAMAHKSNPVDAEVLVALARQVGGLSGTLNQALVHEYERSGAAWTLEWLTLPPMLVATGASLRVGRNLVSSLRFD